MACPTCEHTMHSIGVAVFWCPRCGTTKQISGPPGVPRNVEALNRLTRKIAHGCTDAKCDVCDPNPEEKTDAQN